MSNVIEVNRVWFFDDDINTDQIVPHQFLTENDPTIIVKNAFSGTDSSIAEEASENDIIVAGKNFGNGSSREEAVFVVRELGISAVIAESFARIYYRNLINNGILAINLPECREKLSKLIEIRIDLNLGVIKGIDRDSKSPMRINFNPIPEFIMKIVSAGGAINMLKKNLHSV